MVSNLPKIHKMSNAIVARLHITTPPRALQDLVRRTVSNRKADMLRSLTA